MSDVALTRDLMMSRFREDVRAWAQERPWLVIAVIFLVVSFDVIVFAFLIGVLGAR
jgi:hypothetical protein